MFTESQMALITSTAQECHDQHNNEMSVSEKLSANQNFTAAHLSILNYLAQECAAQQSGPLSVYWMATGYNLLHSIHLSGRPLTVEDLLELGVLIEPDKNANGTRRIPVYFDRTGTTLPWENIDEQLPKLVESQDQLYPLEFHWYFERNIHPFADGNGRVGSLLFNFFNKTLGTPLTEREFATHHE